MAEDITKEVSWNASQGIIFQISNLLDTATKRYLEGKNKEWFFRLKAIKMRIIQSLESGERKELKEKEGEIEKLFSSNKIIDKVKITSAIERYNELLMDFLDEYGYLIQKKTDMGRMF